MSEPASKQSSTDAKAASSDTSQDYTDRDMPLMAHLVELRNRLLRAVIAVLVIFLALAYFANDIYELLARPLMAHLPEGSTMVATGVIAPFLTPFKLTFFAAIFLAMPVILHQVWQFISPGLYRSEKRLAIPLLISSIVLFYLGSAFSYFVVSPLAFQFLAGTTPDGVSYLPDISNHLDIALKFFFAFGLAFEIPIATMLLIWSGVTTVESLKEKRPYIIVGVFVVGMLLTPPDIISQTLLAIPMWILFELGIIMSRIRPAKRSETSEETTPP